MSLPGEPKTFLSRTQTFLRGDAAKFLFGAFVLLLMGVLLIVFAWIKTTNSLPSQVAVWGTVIGVLLILFAFGVFVNVYQKFISATSMNQPEPLKLQLPAAAIDDLKAKYNMSGGMTWSHMSSPPSYGTLGGGMNSSFMSTPSVAPSPSPSPSMSPYLYVRGNNYGGSATGGGSGGSGGSALPLRTVRNA